MGDSLYSNVVDILADNCSAPLQLLAQRIECDYPVTGACRELVSRRELVRLLGPIPSWLTL
ncbi:hypothetical protein [Mycobacterium lepromatosis]|uniref:hypothetical protein n=1 Tax=Mycobacterium lepromatosis TaxID=480418 RepID=UPI000A815173|nr:hypothetical protein [Mycobacterium lepromatosis]